MKAAGMMKRIAKVSPGFKARMAGALFLLLVLTAAFTEFFARGKLNLAAEIAASVIEVSCMIAVTLLCCMTSSGPSTGAFPYLLRASTSSGSSLRFFNFYLMA